MECYDRILKFLDALHTKNPKNEAIAIRLFNQYSKSNDYQNMNKMSVKLEKNFGYKEYALYSIQSTYMFSQQK